MKKMESGLKALPKGKVQPGEKAMTRPQYRRAMDVIGQLMTRDPSKYSLEGKALRILSEIVERYEISMGW